MRDEVDMNSHDYTAHLFIHDDGTLAVFGADIRGLIIEADTFAEIEAELLRVVPLLLRSNHGLSDEDIAHVTLRVEHRAVEDTQPAPKPSLRVFWEDYSRIAATAGA